ncbi:MAG: CHRD domain-containing protein [Thermoanaerobaculia bacterium]
MTRQAISLCFSLLLVGVLAADDDPEPGPVTLHAELRGASEVPPGDEDGSGTATVTVDLERTELCFELTVAGIGDATAAHVHDGVEGEVGPPVVTLEPPDTFGSSDGCVHLSGELLKRLVEQPEGHYVNVHTAEHPRGALRGQLAR